jgi:hypothetical protein
MDVLETYPPCEHMARLMFGPYNVTYLEKLQVDKNWKDDEGFLWGWNVMYADRDIDGPYICIASMYEGLGNYHQKVFRENIGVVDRFVG